MRKIHFIILLSISLLVISCKGGKAVIGSEKADRSLSSKEIIKTHNAALPNFNTIAARMHVLYENGEDMQSLTVSMRMEKDQKIWI